MHISKLVSSSRWQWFVTVSGSIYMWCVRCLTKVREARCWVLSPDLRIGTFARLGCFCLKKTSVWGWERLLVIFQYLSSSSSWIKNFSWAHGWLNTSYIFQHLMQPGMAMCLASKGEQRWCVQLLVHTPCFVPLFGVQCRYGGKPSQTLWWAQFLRVVISKLCCTLELPGEL